MKVSPNVTVQINKADHLSKPVLLEFKINKTTIVKLMNQTNYCRSIGKSICQSIDQSINQSINQSKPLKSKLISQSIHYSSLPPVRPGLEFRIRRHMQVEFVVGYPPCHKNISPRFSLSLPWLPP